MPHMKRILSEENIPKLLLTTALPAMAAGVIELMYNVVDSIFIGHFVGDNALAALSLINSLQLFYLSVGLLFAVGCSSIISRALGAKKEQLAVLTLKHGFWMALFTSLLVSAVCLFRLDDFLRILGASEHTLSYAKSYGGIILWTAFVGPVNNVLISSIRAKGLVPQAMSYVFVGALANIVLDALFIAVFRWGGAGAAAATAISQFIVMFLAFHKVQEVYKLRFRIKEHFSFAVLRDILAIGFPSGTRLFLFSSSVTLANKNLSFYGVEALSSYSIVHRVMPIAMIMIFGLAGGGQPLLGINFGAGNFSRSRQIIKTLLLFCFYFSLPPLLLFWWAPPQIFQIFTKTPQIISMGQEALRWCGGFLILWAYFAITAEILQALGRAKESFILVAFYPGCLIFGQLVFPQIWGLKGIWAATPFSFICSFALAWVFLLRILKSLKNRKENGEKSFTF